MLVAPQIHSIEGSGEASQMQLDVTHEGNGSNNAKDTKFSNDACADAFRLLRVMVTNVFRDFLASRNAFADHLLQHFYRWLSSSSSLLYDPTLHAMVVNLMHKLFLQLLAEFRRLGGDIVYADFSKVCFYVSCLLLLITKKYVYILW